uniref:glutamate decarboxylase n=1 Tax=Astyanax mexicanus TaxID=7994 RepID=A0A8B9HCR5_ASTMX
MRRSSFHWSAAFSRAATQLGSRPRQQESYNGQLEKADGIPLIKNHSYNHSYTFVNIRSCDPQVAPTIKARMMEYGTTMVSYQPQGDKVNFFRMVISNPAATFEDIDFLIEEIERLGQDL